MSYEQAPATTMLATHCCVCNRPLCDSISVEVGMGPTCRERHGYDAELCELDVQTQKVANQIIHKCAVHRDDEQVRAECCATLRLLGFRKLPDRIQYRGKDAPKRRPVVVRRSSKGTGYYVSTPYVPAATEAWRGIAGRRWDSTTKENFVPNVARHQLWQLLCDHYPGWDLVVEGSALTPGPVVIPNKLAA